MRFGDGWVTNCAPPHRYAHMVFEQFLSVPGRQAVITSVDSIDAVDLDVRRYLVLVDPPGKTTIGLDVYPPISPPGRTSSPRKVRSSRLMHPCTWSPR